MLSRPHLIYINWSSYDELSDVVQLTESLAMQQFEAVSRLRRSGVPIDAYLMDCFWHARGGGYREWRQPHWPNGPEAWLSACQAEGILPGLWFGTNNLRVAQMDPTPAWLNSVTGDGATCSMFEGGFWPDFLNALRGWYDRGVRVFKFDFADFSAATPVGKRTLLPHEIFLANRTACLGGLRAFKEACPEAILLAYNGFEEASLQSNTFEPIRKVVDGRLLDVFDGLYCGDPRPADVPAATFWRAKDVYSDHQVWNYLQNQVPASRIDSSAFMIGLTGTCYFRGKARWKGMLLLELVRAGWTNTLYGNLDLLDDADAAWMARATRSLLPLQQTGSLKYHGTARPGDGLPYAWELSHATGGVMALVNPSQDPAVIPGPAGRVLFAECPSLPSVTSQGWPVAPEQVLLVGWGDFDSLEYELGADTDWPTVTDRTVLASNVIDDSTLTLEIPIPAGPAHSIRVIVQQFDSAGNPCRTTGGAPPNGTLLGDLLQVTINDAHNNAVIPTREDHKQIWSGLSWGVVEFDATGAGSWQVTVKATDPRVRRISASAAAITYAPQS